uniref:TGF-beta family profile domain-containing protein n=1 Tax=Oryctolagus cuniculus TaxID=9986 RepID=G1TYB9_RABIT
MWWRRSRGWEDGSLGPGLWLCTEGALVARTMDRRRAEQDTGRTCWGPVLPRGHSGLGLSGSISLPPGPLGHLPSVSPCCAHSTWAVPERPLTPLLSPEVGGQVLLSDASTHLLVFGMEKRAARPNSELVQAVFHSPPRGRGAPAGSRGREVLRPRGQGAGRRTGLCLRLVSLHESGWKTFDVTEAVTFWQQPLLLLVSVHREHLGPGASSAHRLVCFPGLERHPDVGGQLRKWPLHLLAQGNCDPEVPLTEGTRCCRQEMFVDLQGMKWAENRILEPPGFVAHECVGSCRQLPEPLSFKWPFLGPRRCIASETAALPMIVSIQEGGRTRPRVVSLPNMRVKQCSCASDGAPVPSRLEP